MYLNKRMRYPSRVTVTALTATALAACGAVVCGTVASAVPAAAATTHTAAVTSHAWNSVPLPSSVAGPSTLADVSAVSRTYALAVGAQAETGPRKGTPLILRWNGMNWVTVAVSGLPAPGYLTSVSAVSKTDAWAVGNDQSKAVVLHWNGKKWAKVSFPGSATATVSAVAATADGTAWLVGSVPAAGGKSTTPLAETWNGTAWSVVSTGLGSGELDNVRVFSSGVWVVGSNTAGAIIACENGGTWTSLHPPRDTNTSTSFTTAADVLALSPTDVWVAGTGSVDQGTQSGSLAEIDRLNGTTWTVQGTAKAAPAVGSLSITAGANGQPRWVSGELGIGVPVRTTEYDYYRGNNTWAGVQGATSFASEPGASSISVAVTANIPGTNATWAVGGSLRPGDGQPEAAFIEEYIS